MAELLFKKGLHANLAAATKKAGTLYVTTDEKCLYMDISDTERIRLQGSVLYFETLEQFYNDVQPPYSTDVIYFIEKAKDGTQFNALMRWRPDADTAKYPKGGEWIQLNATAASVEAAIADLQRQVTANAQNLAGHQTALEGILNRIGVLEGYVGKPAEGDAAATGLHARMDTAESDIDAIEADIGDDATAGSVKGRIKAVEDEIGDDATAGSVKGRIKTAEGKISDLEGTVETLATKESVTELGDGLQEQIDDINAEIGDPAKERTDEEGKTLWAAIESNDADIADIKEQLGSGSEAGSITERLKNVEDKANANQDAISDIVADLGIPETPAYGADITTLYGQVIENKTDIADHETRVGALETTVGDANGGLVKKAEDNRLAIAQNAADIDANEKAIGAVSDALEKHAEDAAKTYATKTEVSEINTALNEKILAANAMRYIGTAASKSDLGKDIEVSVGDTYVASTDLYNDDGSLFAHAGDLIIAKGEEIDGVVSTESLSWDVVDTGYVKAHENKLVLEQTTANSDPDEANAATVTVNLQNYADEVVSAFAIKTVSDNVTVTRNDAVIEVGLRWAEF